MAAKLFWEPDDAPAPSVTATAIADWEAAYEVRLPTLLARALLTQNGGFVHGAAVGIEPLAGFTPLDAEQWDGVWADGPLADADRGRQFYIGESAGVGVVLDYADGPAPRVLLLHHGQGRELRDHGFGSFEEFIRAARADE